MADDDMIFPMDYDSTFRDPVTGAPLRNPRRERPPPERQAPSVRPAALAAKRYKEVCHCQKDNPLPSCITCNKQKTPSWLKLPSLSFLRQVLPGSAAREQATGACGGTEERPDKSALPAAEAQTQQHDSDTKPEPTLSESHAQRMLEVVDNPFGAKASALFVKADEQLERAGLGICGPTNVDEAKPQASGPSRSNVNPPKRRVRDHQRRVEAVHQRRVEVVHQRRVEAVPVPNYTDGAPRLPLARPIQQTNEDELENRELIFHVQRPRPSNCCCTSRCVCDYCATCRNSVERITTSLASLPFYFLLMGFPIAMSYMGFKYLQDCPMSRLIPVFLCVIGLAGVLCLVVRMLDVIRRWIFPENSTHKCLPVVAVCLLLAIVALLIADIVLLRSKPNFEDKESTDYCDPTFYRFTYYANYAGLLIISIPCIIYATCAFCKQDFEQ